MRPLTTAFTIVVGALTACNTRYAALTGQVAWADSAELELAATALEASVMSVEDRDTLHIVSSLVAATRYAPDSIRWLADFIPEGWHQGVAPSLYMRYWHANRSVRPFPVPESIAGRPVVRARGIRGEALPIHGGVHAVSRVGYNLARDSALVSVIFACRGLCGTENTQLWVRHPEGWRFARSVRTLSH